MKSVPFYNPTKSYQENFIKGPFGVFSNNQTLKHLGEPQHRFLDFPVYQPFGIPAGSLINANFVQAAFKKGFDLCVYKTVRTRVYPCHPHPNILAVHVVGKVTLAKAKRGLVADTDYDAPPLSITNSFGVPSKKILIFGKRI